MAGFIKAIIVAMLTTVIFMVITNLIFFFPFYMKLIYETYSITQLAAIDNYVETDSYNDALDGLKEAPIFNKNPDKVTIEVLNANNSTAVGTKNDSPVPYLQRGAKIDVEIKAEYPLRINFMNQEITRNVPVSFKLSTTGLRFYKDLDFYDNIEFNE